MLKILSKYGFFDGEEVLEEERETVHRAAWTLCEALGRMDLWSPCVVETWGHNPWYVSFVFEGESEEYGYQQDQLYGYYDMKERDRRRIDARLKELFSRENASR